ncbi:MAG TPA: orotate phosphoribosyltransferase [Xanthomonadales bacterium]|nr:orotate phosphoribosyltransferase [Xanthomonadales bacterium]
MSFRTDFLDLSLRLNVLRFGEFTLKSGRVSPYFFNAGLINTGSALSALGRAYAQTLVDQELPFDMLFGPAYKGIALASATAIALADGHGRDLPFAFNRKEAKDHGEGGMLIGAPLAGRVVIVDDVISAGTSVRESVTLIRAAGATPAAVLIALDRQERGQGARSAADEVREEFGIPVLAIANLTELLGYVAGKPELAAVLPRLQAYRAEYGV